MPKKTGNRLLARAARKRARDRAALVVFLITGSAWAQSMPTVQGVVTEAGTGTPIADADVVLGERTPHELRTKTDARGHYELRVDPGDYRISANALVDGRPDFRSIKSRPLKISAGQEVTGFDFQLPVSGSISGRVTDDNDEPVQGAHVMLVGREYGGGSLRYVLTGGSITNDLGEYTIEGVEKGRAWLLIAEMRNFNIPAISDVPENPERRRHPPALTWYPNSPSLDGAQPVTLRAEQKQLDAVNIRMRRSASYCVDGVLESNSHPDSLNFSITEAQPTSGHFGNGGFYWSEPSGRTAKDGRFRVCDLHPGEYKLTVNEAVGNPAGGFANTLIVIGDRDVHDVKAHAASHLTVSAEVVLWGPPPATPLSAHLGFHLTPANRASMGGEFQRLAAIGSDIPGSFTIPDLLLDEYMIDANLTDPDLYIRDITYGSHSVLRDTLRVGSETGDAAVRVTVGTDGGKIQATAVDSNGNAVGDAHTLVLPADISSVGDLAQAMNSGSTGADGTWNSRTLAPGDYFVLATNDVTNRSPEDMDRIWRARRNASKVTVKTNASTSVKVVVAPLN